MKNILLTIAYDGTNYHGWQRQKNAISIQQVLENTCSQVFKKQVLIRGAGRTDTGVHALGQCATFQSDTTIPIEKIPFVLNSKLPSDIVIQSAKEMPADFHPQYSAKRKTYRYQIINTEFAIPQERNYSAFVSRTLNAYKMQEAASYFVGTHDFQAFCASGSSVKSTIRTIYECRIIKQQQRLILEITGNGFLYKMVRIIVGTLLDVGTGKKNPEDIPNIIEARERKNARITAPPQGLTLYSIKYD